MKEYYTGNIKYLIQNNYELDCDYCRNYYTKIIRNRTTRKKLQCFINAKTMEISYIGDASMLPYFKKELHNYTIYK